MLSHAAGASQEAERQLTAAVDRHREALASMGELGRPESGQHVAVKAVGRAVQLVVFALRHAAQCRRTPRAARRADRMG